MKMATKPEDEDDRLCEDQYLVAYRLFGFQTPFRYVVRHCQG